MALLKKLQWRGGFGMMPDDCLCDCFDSNIRRVDTKHPHLAINREGWFCMGYLTEFEIKRKTTEHPLIRENELLAFWNNEIKQSLILKKYLSYALEILEKMDYEPSDADSPTSFFSAELSEDWFFHVKWKLQEILKQKSTL